MTESLNRKIARRYSKAVSNENFRSDGTLLASATIYDSTVDLPTSGVERGAQGYVSSNQRLYIRGTGGWYNIATINNTPTINSVQTAAGDSSPFTLATDGTTTTVITITATDSEGFPITFSAVTDVGFDSIATVSQDSSVFTITPFSQDSAGDATSGTLTFKVSDGVNIASEVATFTITFRAANSNFTTLLMKASGNNGTNTSINDASSNNHSVSVNGNAVAQSFTPHHPGGYSTYFDGTGDYLQAASSSDFAFGSNDFTIEFWAYPRAITTAVLLDPRTGDNQAVPWIGLRNDGYWYYYVSGVNRIVGTAGSVTTNKWYHVAVSRSSGTTKMFVNGTQNGSDYSDSTSYVQGGPWRTGTRYNGTTLPYNGYVRDFRCINGTALYTTNFTPPTEPLTAVANTKLLHSHLPYFDDGSSSNHSLTISGDTKTERFGPYDYLNYSASSHGASVYFDGTGDYLTVADDASLQPGSSDFTYEAWIYPTSAPNTYNSIFYKRGSGANYSGVAIAIKSSGVFSVLTASGSGSWGIVDESSASYKLNEWQHIAAVRSGSSFKFYVNGVQKISTTISFSVYDMGSSQSIGAGAANGDQPFTGYIADARIVKGSAIYTSAFTPPTAPLTVVTNTQLLTCNDAPNVFNANGTSNNVALGGTAKSSTAQTKNATASMLFDGNSDYVELSNYRHYAPGTQDFVVEFWMRYTGGSGTRNIIDNRGNNDGYAIRLDSSNKITVYSEPSNSTKHTSASALTQDQWYHIAFVRNNGDSYLFIDGAQSGSAATNADNYASISMVIGAQHAKNQQYFPGYVEDVRISTGTNRYPFIPFSETLTSTGVSGTQLLACHAATIVDGTGTHTINSNSSPAVVDFGPHPGMKSVSFDGTDDRLYIADGDYKTFGTGEYTIECWIYPEEASQGTYGDYFWGDGATGSNASGSNELMYTTDDKLRWYFITTGSNTMTSSFALTPYKWYHVACQRSGNVFQMFVNGSLAASTDAGAVTVNNSTGVWTIGDYGNTYGTTAPPKCKISNFRIVKGSAVYSNSFTPPTEEIKG